MEKKKTSVRFVAGAAALCITATFAGPSPAGAQTARGVGTTEASHALLRLELGAGGRSLSLGVMVDTAKSTIDSAVSAPVGFSRLEPLSLKSGALPLLETIAPNLPTFESRTPGGEPSVKGEALNLASPGGNALPLGLLAGSLVPVSLTSGLDGAAGARSALESALADVSVLSGVLTLDSVGNLMSTSAAPSNAAGTRSVQIGAVALLDLGDLLGALGLGLADLPLEVISKLVEALKLPLPLPAGAGTLATAVGTLTAAINGASAPVLKDAGVASQEVKEVTEALNVVNGLPATLTAVSGKTVVATESLKLPDKTVQELIATLQATLANLLGIALSAVDDVTLLELDGAKVSASTVAADTLANSSANVTAGIGGLTVLGHDLPGVDLLSVGEMVNSVTSLLSDVLGIIGLGDLVRVAVLDKNTSVTAADGYINALASVDVLSVTVKPPPLLSNLVASLTSNVGLSSLGILGAAGVASPAGSLPLLGANALALGKLLDLPAAVGALTEGLSLKIGSVKSTSQFRLASAPTEVAAAPNDILPRTGGDTRALGVLAAGMAALALGVRRWARRPEVHTD